MTLMVIRTLLAMMIAFPPALALAQEPFTRQVAADFGKGLAGDDEALARAMKRCEDELAANPKHAEAMVWHGSATLSLAGRMFRRGDFARGAEAWQAGQKEMDTAVALEPDNSGVLMVRGATMLEASKHFPGAEEARAMLEKGIADYEKAVSMTRFFDSLSPEGRGRLLVGLANGWSRMGDAARSRALYERVLTEAKGTAYAETATQALGK
jgi:hypothetical protein